MAYGLAIFAVTCAAADDPIRASAVGLFKDKAVLDINGVRRVLKVGAQSPEGVLLVKSTSESATIEIDGERIDLRLDGKIVGHYVRGIAAKSLQIYPDSSGHYQVDGMINGNSIRFLIDTGATSVSINQATAKRIGLLYRVDGSPTVVETAAGIVAAYRVQFDEVKIRSLTVKRVEGLVLDGEFPRTALLGQSFLNRLDMQRDGNMLELRER
jgi:aspartyl protease family protein